MIWKYSLSVMPPDIGRRPENLRLESEKHAGQGTPRRTHSPEIAAAGMSAALRISTERASIRGACD
jgi:hypothetical protein